MTNKYTKFYMLFRKWALGSCLLRVLGFLFFDRLNYDTNA
jgi:hypothetical protein